MSWSRVSSSAQSTPLPAIKHCSVCRRRAASEWQRLRSSATLGGGKERDERNRKMKRGRAQSRVLPLIMFSGYSMRMLLLLLLQSLCREGRRQVEWKGVRGWMKQIAFACLHLSHQCSAGKFTISSLPPNTRNVRVQLLQFLGVAQHLTYYPRLFLN